MKKAIQISYNGSFEKKCRYAAQAGFRAMSVNFNDMDDRSPEAWAAAPENIRPYIAYYDGEGAVQYIYGAVLTRSVQDVLTAA